MTNRIAGESPERGPLVSPPVPVQPQQREISSPAASSAAVSLAGAAAGTTATAGHGGMAEVGVSLLRAQELSPSRLLTLKREVMRSQRRAGHFQSELDQTYGVDSKGDAQVLRGVGLWLLGRHRGALDTLEPHRGKPVADFIIAEIHLRADRVAEAIALYSKLAEKAPAEPLYRLRLAEAAALVDDSEGFERAVQKYLAVDPEGANAHYLKGMLAEHLGDYDEAVQRYATAVVSDPTCAGARFQLAQHHYLRGDEEKAVELYEQLAKRPPSSIAALVNLGVIHEDREEYDEAIRCYRAILAYYPDHVRARLYLRDAEASKEMFYDEERERKEDKKAQILRIPVTDFELSVRSRNCLAKMNLHTLGDLITKTEAELLAFKNFGETSLAEIKEILRQKGLRLGMVTEEERVKDQPKPPPDPDSVSNKPIGDLDLSVRSRKACDLLKVQTVGDLTRVTETELLGCRNFGQTSLNEIKKKLADMGLSLRS
ncbi:MAG: DNA-directed RNA polymerase subunit alpha C-terminal domain-containing protein [Planctomycetota bacterium]